MYSTFRAAADFGLGEMRIAELAFPATTLDVGMMMAVLSASAESLFPREGM